MALGIGISGPRGGGGGAIPSLSIGVYSDADLTTPITTADFGDTVYIKLTVVGITPTNYRFFICENNVNFDLIEQASNIYAKTISTFNDLVIYGEAEDGSIAACALDATTFSINADADANAFINAHNAASGQVMAALQQEVIQGTFQRLKGSGTTNGSDLWTIFKNSGTRIFPYTPVNDATVNVVAYGLDMIQLESQTFHGYIPADYSVNGLIGGTGKYTKTGMYTTDFDINNIGGDVYRRTTSNAIQMSFGTMTASVWSSATDGYSLWTRYSNQIFTHANSGWVGSAATNGIGHTAMQRTSNSNVALYKNGVLLANLTKASVAQSALEIYGHAMNSSVGDIYNDPSEHAWLCPARPKLTDNEMQDYYEVIEYYQSNIITGGRNV